MIIDPKKIIIDRPDRQSLRHRATAVLLFFMFWGAFLYLLKPLLMILGWWLGYRVFQSVAGDLALIQLLDLVYFKFLPLVLLLSGSLWGWAWYNRMRFRGKRDKRRVAPPLLALEDVAAAYRVTVEQIHDIYNAKGLVCHFSQESGEIRAVDCCSTPDELARIYNQRVRERKPPIRTDKKTALSAELELEPNPSK